MALLYTFTKYKDTYTITNDGVIDLTYTVSNLSCDSSTLISTIIIKPDTTKNIVFLYDGKYQILLDDGIEQETIEVDIYYDLLTSFIDDVEAIVCGCKECDGCEDCNSCNQYLAGLTKAFAFNSLNSSLYQSFINNINETFRCDFNDTVACAMLKNKVYGNEELTDIINKLIGYYYFAFYFKDTLLAIDDEEKDYINTKYKFTKISKCMKKVGITITDAIEIFENGGRVYYWQLESIEEDIDNVLSLLSSSYLNNQPNIDYIEFEQGKNVIYTGLGRIVFVVSPTQVQDFEIRDSLNNNITDEFDNSYNLTLNAAIFVSKSYYNPMTLYFKFKKQL